MWSSRTLCWMLNVYISLPTFQNLGYRGEVGYQTFLYSNESDVRKVFMFLIEKIPRDSAEAVEESLGES